MKTIFLLSGYSHSGKDTMGAYLKTTHGCFLYAFANALKKQVATEFKFPYEYTQTQHGKETVIPFWNKTVRELLLERGQAIRREMNQPGYFAEIVADQILEDMLKFPEQRSFVITDWRLPEEYETIQQRFLDQGIHVLKVRIERDGQLFSPVHHWTETSLGKTLMNYHVWNPATSLPAFYRIIESFLETLRHE